MAKFALKAGAEIDVLTSKELKAEVDSIRQQMANGIKRDWFTTGEIVTVDSNGSLGVSPDGNLIGVPLYTCPTGRCAELHRIAITANGYDPSNPLTTGWLQWDRGNPSLTSLIMIVGGGVTLPTVVVEGTGAAVVRNGEHIVVSGKGLPANLQLGISLQLRLFDVA